jgi:hypothetical protein
MIRMVDDKGALFVGLVRGTLVERLVAGERVCIPGHIDGNGLLHPHICLVLRDDNEQLLEAARDFYPDGFLPGALTEHVSPDEPT